MKLRITSVAILAVALALPASAIAERGGHGAHGQNHGSGENSWRGSQQRGGDHGGGWNRGGGGQSTRGGGERWRSGDGGQSARGGNRYRGPSDSWRGSQSPRTYARDRGSYAGRQDYSHRVRYRGDYSGHSRYRYGGYHSFRPRHFYYTSHFFRPRYLYRSGFSLGFVIGAVPAVGYRYFDPYCDTYYSSLDDYYGHCEGFSHPEAIVVIDARYGDPVATCIYNGGGWVVDDCGGY